MNDIIKAQRILQQTGGYCCPHFKLAKSDLLSTKNSCCGSSGSQYAPYCTLIKGICTGLAQCPRLDIKSKSEYIQAWKEDISNNISVNPLEYIK